MLAYLASMGWFGIVLAVCFAAVGVSLMVSVWFALIYLADMQEFD